MENTKSKKQFTRYGILIPAYREEARIADVVTCALRHCPEVLVVDDGSDDRTAERADQAGALVIRHDVNRGKGVAMNTALNEARVRGYDAIITLDGDGQHDPDEIPVFIEAYERTGIPVLIGNRMADVQDMPLIRRWTNRFMSWMLSRSMGQYIPDTQCGYRLYRCDLIPYLSADSSRFAAESEILLHLAERGVRMDSVRIKTIYADGQSKINPITDTVRFFTMIIQYEQRRRRILHGR